MSPTQVVALLVRLFALGLVAFALRQLQWLLSAEVVIVSAPVIASMTILFFVAIFLWRFPMKVAGSIVRVDFERGRKHQWSTDELYCCGIVVAGLFFLFWSLSDMIYWLTFWWALAQEDAGYGVSGIENKAATLATVGEFVFALSLLFGFKGWRRLIYRIRYGKSPQ